MADSNRYTLANCCLCLSLRAGSLIIGIISLVFSLLGAGYSIYLGITGGAEGWVDMAIDLVHFVLAVILIHGIRTERVVLLRVWIIGTGFLVGLSIILGIVIIILTNSILAAILLLVVSAIQIYFILVVRSYALSVLLWWLKGRGQEGSTPSTVVALECYMRPGDTPCVGYIS